MQLYPAIDIKGGQCVRLTQGLFDNVKVYSDTPADMARMWRDQGATFLHLVDLDGALAGRSVNEAVIRSIVEAIDIPVEIGGGIRTAEAVRNMLDLGVARVIIGTKAVERPEFMGELVAAFGPERIVAGVDARDGYVAVSGWKELSAEKGVDFCRRLRDAGVQNVIYTDISRDGAEQGTNLALYRELAKIEGLDITASGGVSSLEELRELRKIGTKAAILGKALYTGRLDLKTVIREVGAC